MEPARAAGGRGSPWLALQTVALGLVLNACQPRARLSPWRCRARVLPCPAQSRCWTASCPWERDGPGSTPFQLSCYKACQYLTFKNDFYLKKDKLGVKIS